MKSSILKYSFPIGLGMVLLIITMFSLVSTTFTSCYSDPPPPNGGGGCGTQMGCCPATGCGVKWYGSSTGLCYTTANACSSGGNSYCRQCY